MVLFLKNLLFTALVPGTIAGFLPWWIARERPLSSGPLLVLGSALLAIGAAIYGWCLWDFATFGRGTPAPIDPPKKLVVRGLYRFVRNPMYVGVICALLGWSALYSDRRLLYYAACLGACFHLFVVLYEERKLRRRFGREYDDYCARVGRWLPRPPRRPRG
jgi:protein-S-isoprenylcysteine O-methyltransferase Ste14